MVQNKKLQGKLEGLLQCLNDAKAENIQVYYVEDYVSYSDHVVIITALSGSHVRALINKTEVYFKEQGVNPFIQTRKQDNYQWVVLDYGSIIIHYFQTKEREFYQLDSYFQKLLPPSKHLSYPPSNDKNTTKPPSKKITSL